MWKPIQTNERLTVGDILRYQPASSGLTNKDKIYEVVKTEVHYLEVIEKQEGPPVQEQPARKVIRYMDIGYHLSLELYSD